MTTTTKANEKWLIDSIRFEWMMKPDKDEIEKKSSKSKWNHLCGSRWRHSGRSAFASMAAYVNHIAMTRSRSPLNANERGFFNKIKCKQDLFGSFRSVLFFQLEGWRGFVCVCVFRAHISLLVDIFISVDFILASKIKRKTCFRLCEYATKSKSDNAPTRVRRRPVSPSGFKYFTFFAISSSSLKCI